VGVGVDDHGRRLPPRPAADHAPRFRGNFHMRYTRDTALDSAEEGRA
jgi:hypothetical protein